MVAARTAHARQTIMEDLAQATPGQGAGPFYPVVKPLDQDADLTRISGRPGQARGQVLHLTGRVLNLEGRPVRGATLELWQASMPRRISPMVSTLRKISSSPRLSDHWRTPAGNTPKSPHGLATARVPQGTSFSRCPMRVRTQKAPGSGDDQVLFVCDEAIFSSASSRFTISGSFLRITVFLSHVLLSIEGEPETTESSGMSLPMPV